MKVVINDCFGGFSINREIAKQHFNDKWYTIERTNPTLIDLIESGINCSGLYSELKVVEIPETATDWRIFDYDGLEYIIYVVDGKIYSINDIFE